MSTRNTFLFLAFVGFLATTSRAVAQFGLPSTANHYAFLPRQSELHRSGGFTGFEVDYRVRGDFDFMIQQSPLAVYPPVYYAKFVNPEVIGYGFTNAIVDVDRVLNLAGITGGQTLYPHRPNLFHFVGTTPDKSTVELNAILRGPWLYLRGGTTPPEGSADYFQYDIRAVARRTPIADVDDNGVVDAADLQALASNASISGGTLLEWQRQLGETPPSLESLDAELDAALAGAAGAVPEPSSLGLLAIAAITVGSARRRLAKSL
jgi:hypothetical protein